MTVETLSLISQVELIDKKKFIKVALDENPEIFIVYVATLVATGADSMKVYPSQIS